MWIGILLVSICLSLSLSALSALLLKQRKDFWTMVSIGSLPILFYVCLTLFAQKQMSSIDLFTLVGLVALAEATVGWRLSLWINPAFKEMADGMEDVTDDKKNLHPFAVLIMIGLYEGVVWLTCWIQSI